MVVVKVVVRVVGRLVDKVDDEQPCRTIIVPALNKPCWSHGVTHYVTTINITAFCALGDFRLKYYKLNHLEVSWWEIQLH
jgi:hypothetical protein